jgi:hypothetical protein
MVSIVEHLNLTLPAQIPTSATQKVDPKLLDFLRGLKAGDRIRATQRIRVGSRQWTTTTDGTFRDLNYLETGLATQRVPADAIVVPLVHFTKDNGELTSITLDEHSQVSKIG